MGECVQMSKKRILVLSDMDFRGSGYFYFMSSILSRMGDYDIKVLGLGYDRREHNYEFSVTAVNNYQDAIIVANQIIGVWKPDIFICAADIPIQMEIQKQLRATKIKYLAITPLENPPLTMSWAAELMMMDWVYFISEVGKNAAIDAGLTNVGRLDMGLDKTIYYPATLEERKEIRKKLGFSDDEFVILTVADNQERKNLWASLSIVAKLKKLGHKVKYVLVTKEHSQVGHKLRDLCVSLEINKETLIIERGIPTDMLRSLYCGADLYLSSAKAEGLCIPILESMGCGTQVAGTDTGAIHELLEDGRGVLLPVEYEFIDVWGNEARSMVNIEKSANIISGMIGGNFTYREKSLLYIQNHDDNLPARILSAKIEEICK